VEEIKCEKEDNRRRRFKKQLKKQSEFGVIPDFEQIVISIVLMLLTGGISAIGLFLSVSSMIYFF
jgi:hypothetical protein